MFGSVLQLHQLGVAPPKIPYLGLSYCIGAQFFAFTERAAEAAHREASLNLGHRSHESETIADGRLRCSVSTSQAEVQAERVEELRREAELAKERADMAELSSGEAGLQFRNLNARIAQLEVTAAPVNE